MLGGRVETDVPLRRVQRIDGIDQREAHRAAGGFPCAEADEWHRAAVIEAGSARWGCDCGIVERRQRGHQCQAKRLRYVSRPPAAQERVRGKEREEEEGAEREEERRRER